MKTLEVWVEGSKTWSPIRAGSDGQPRYVSNGALVGNGMRITRVYDQNNPPTAGDVTFPENTNG